MSWRLRVACEYLRSPAREDFFYNRVCNCRAVLISSDKPGGEFSTQVSRPPLLERESSNEPRGSAAKTRSCPTMRRERSARAGLP